MATPNPNIALTRFGLGARPGDSVGGDPQRWLIAQFDQYHPRPAPIAAAPVTRTVAIDLIAYQDERRAMRMQTAAPAPTMMPAADAIMPTPPAPTAMADDKKRPFREAYATAIGARAQAALLTDAPFVERMVHFWANHFAVSADKQTVVGFAGPMEFEAIRPHVLGKFGDMLGAVERHPAMLLYLDQAVSIGPGSQRGQRAAARGGKRAGLNENLAREILELHTLGVRTGYGQADVTELARALTGWTVGGLGPLRQAEPGAFLFAPALHEPGDRMMLGKRYGAAGEAQGQAVLADLATHPATARHLATKLTRHFAADDPPPAMVARLEAAYLRSGGDLPTMYRAIVESPEAWTGAKFRNPWDWGIASMRALGQREVRPGVVAGLMTQLGQPVWKPGQPSGYDDTAAAWAGPDAILRRVEAASRFAGRGGVTDARALTGRLFPGGVSALTTQAIARAESPAEALALLLVAPESMRR
ncbi:DUF1800 domain-containing protein [Sphingomonas sp. Leaf339]|uniref:DUF1800 domain-containing protein n=1 Tax=Sphingomonas sp. Leaf339 TaxID=1736343 RepID=UPI000AABD1D8|nr:DUF1800 domain-containing protein [Sphingomonas sp. Leaf339]